MDNYLKLQYTIDSLFGNGVSKNLPKDIDINLSRKTGRIRTVSYKKKLLCTLRIDGGLAISPFFAQMLLKNKSFKENCVEINQDAYPFVKEGRSVFCKHIIKCGKNVHISTDTPVIYKNQVIAVGKAVLSYEMILDFNKGVAIKVRDSLKSRNEEIQS